MSNILVITGPDSGVQGDLSAAGGLITIKDINFTNRLTNVFQTQKNYLMVSEIQLVKNRFFNAIWIMVLMGFLILHL